MIKLINISYRYPFKEEYAVRNVECEIHKGEAVLFTGGSGCGKSTLIRIINGLIPHFFQGNLEGRVEIDGIDNNTRSIPDIAQNTGTLFQDPEQQFFTLDVESELAFAHEQRGDEPEEIRILIEQISEKLGITHIKKSSIFEISEGEKQKVALGSVLSMGPGILLLDEPTANLDHCATCELAKMLLKLKREGMTLVIVDHRLYWLESLIDTVYILEKGEIVKKDSLETFRDKVVQQNYGLRDLQTVKILKKIRSLPPVLIKNSPFIRIEDLVFGYKGKLNLFTHCSFEFPKGKITVITGSNGCGKTTLARILTGLVKTSKGHIVIDGQAVPPKELLKRAGLVFQNADHQLFMSSVKRELLTSGRMLKKKIREQKTADLLEQLNLSEFTHAHPQSLSGGQKQRLVIACALMKSPDVLILDEPTSGLDGKNMHIISNLLRQTANEGAAVIVITHDLELIASTSDYNLDLTPNKETP